MESLVAHPGNEQLLDRIEAFVDRATGWVAGIAVLGLLVGAIFVVVDVLLRWQFKGGVYGLHELMGQIFGMAVAATLPAGIARRVNLKVDLMGGHFGPRLTKILSVFGSISFAVFYFLILVFVSLLAVRFVEQGRTTALIHWPIGITYVFISVAIALALATQFIKLWREVISSAESIASATSVYGYLLSGVLFIIVIGTFGWFVFDFESLQNFAFDKPGTYVAIGFALLWVAVLCQIPLAPVTGLIGFFGCAVMIDLSSTGNVLATESLDFLTNWNVATLPLFLLMGSFAVAAGISTDIYNLANAALGRIKGGLAYATVAGCAGFGAVSGTSIATAATFGRMGLPEMARHNYDPQLSTGSVAAGGTLGSLVPPSGAIILFALLTQQSIGILFVAAMLPALLALLLYFMTIWILLRINPERAPAINTEPQALLPALWSSSPVILLFGVVIGGLYGGVFTATESAAFGAVGAFLLALFRGKLNRNRLVEVFTETTATTAMIYALIFGALIFSFYINLGQAPEFIASKIAAIDASPTVVLLILLFFYLLLGAVMDSYAIMIITVPVVTPLVLGLGFDIFHWGVLMLVVVEIGLISPPFGINLFILKTIQPDVAIGKIMKGVLPFLAADLVKVLLLVLFPIIALWLPSTMSQ